MKNFNIIIISFLFVFYYISGFSQDFQNEDKYQELFGKMGGQKFDNLSSAAQLNLSINPNKYIVDVGDIFIIKIDVKGPASKVFTAPVYPEGYLMLEDVPSVYVKKMTLQDAKKKIIRSIKQKYNDALIEVFLYSIHPIEVTVLGAISKPGILELKSSDRLYAAYKMATMVQGETAPPEDQEINLQKNPPPVKIEEIISLRNVVIERNGEKVIVDLLKFEKTGNLNENPYLQNEDIIYFPYVDQDKYKVHVNGAVGNIIIYEYDENETLNTALNMAGGLLPSADSSEIKLYRFNSGDDSLLIRILKFPRDSSFMLEPDDRIFVNYIPDFHIKNSVELIGEVKYPGIYAIIDGETTLLEIIRQAGKFTNQASIKNSLVVRSKFLPEDKELERISTIPPSDMTTIEHSYFKLRNRENLRFVSVNFAKLFIDNEVSENVILRDEDVIIVPEIKNIVYISGGVISPGNVTHHPGWTYLDYISSAGGYNSRARENWTKIIKNKTSTWLDAEKEVVIEDGDIIFVPEREETDWFDVFKDTLTIVFQLATIALLVANLAK